MQTKVPVIPEHSEQHWRTLSTLNTEFKKRSSREMYKELKEDIPCLQRLTSINNKSVVFVNDAAVWLLVHYDHLKKVEG